MSTESQPFMTHLWNLFLDFVGDYLGFLVVIGMYCAIIFGVGCVIAVFIRPITIKAYFKRVTILTLCLVAAGIVGLLSSARLLALFVVACVIAAFSRPVPFKAYLRRVGKLALFLVILFILGAFSSSLLMNVALKNREFGVPTEDMLMSDSTPFWPLAGFHDSRFEEDFIAHKPAQVYRFSLGQLQVLYLLFQGGAWGLTVLLYRRLSRRWFAHQVPTSA